jgi:hypothetical protein
MLVEGQFILSGSDVRHGQIVVAVLAFQRATMGHLNGHFDGRAASLLALMHLTGKLTVIDLLQQSLHPCTLHLTPPGMNTGGSAPAVCKFVSSQGLNQVFLEQRPEKILDIRLRLTSRHFKLVANALNHLRQRMPFG